MLGAAALTSLAALRSGAGLVTAGIPESLNRATQKKISNTVMTFPLKETTAQTLSFSAFKQIKDAYSTYSAIAIGPGLSRNASTHRLILKVIETSPLPLIIDADALNALCQHLNSLLKTKTTKILTPHPGEMARLTRKTKKQIEKNREDSAISFARRYNCTLLLKGAKTVVASKKKLYINATGNVGMATAGSGDVLTGMIAAFITQGLTGFEAAKYGAHLHGKAGDFAAKAKTQISMIASDIIDCIPDVIRTSK